MNSSLRDYLETLSGVGEVQEVPHAVDPRYISSLAADTEKALWFRNLPGYDFSVLTRLFSGRERLALGLGVPVRDLHRALNAAPDNLLAPVFTDRVPAREQMHLGDEVDLSSLPIPIMSAEDGAPYITSGVAIAEDPESGFNAGVYRLMLVDRQHLTIKPDRTNDLYTILRRAERDGRAVPVSISIGVHPRDLLAACYLAPLGVSELAIAGALRGEPLELAAGRTVDVPCVANAEIVLEGEISPISWSHDEGRFGEVDGLTGGLYQAPLLKVSALCHRRDAIFYALHMPVENMWLMGAMHEAKAWRILQGAGIEVAGVNVTPGGCCRWHVVAAIGGEPGTGRKALQALLSSAGFKQAIVTTPDIDIHDPAKVEWAVATRVQVDRDVLIIPQTPGESPDGLSPASGSSIAKMGIDATICGDRQEEILHPIRYPYLGRVTLGEAAAGGLKGPAEQSGEPPAELVSREIQDLLSSEPLFYAGILARFEHLPYRTVVQAMGLLRSRGCLGRDEAGRYVSHRGVGCE